MLMSAQPSVRQFRVRLHHRNGRHHSFHHHGSDRCDWPTRRRPVLYFKFCDKALLLASIVEYYQPVEESLFLQVLFSRGRRTFHTLLTHALLYPRYFHPSFQDPFSNMTPRSSRSPSSLLSATKASSARIRSSQRLKERAEADNGSHVSGSEYNASKAMEVVTVAGTIAGPDAGAVVGAAAETVAPASIIPTAASVAMVGDGLPVTTKPTPSGTSNASVIVPNCTSEPAQVAPADACASDATNVGAKSLATASFGPLPASATATTQDAKDSVPSPSSLFTNPAFTTVPDAIEAVNFGTTTEATVDAKSSFAVRGGSYVASTAGSSLALVDTSMKLECRGLILMSPQPLLLTVNQ